jgi:histidine triad (HIT) family protein
MSDSLSPCAFCDIIGGRRPQEIVYSDATVVGFLCRPPATAGHVLVVPREHRRDIWDIAPEEATAVIAAARVLAAVMRDDLGAVGVNLRQNTGSKAGQDVFHFHLHVIPRYESDTVLPGCVWGVPPWEPPPDGAEEREQIAAVLRRGASARTG